MGALVPLLISLGSAIWQGYAGYKNQKSQEDYQNKLLASSDADRKQQARAQKLANMISIMGYNVHPAESNIPNTPLAPHMMNTSIPEGLGLAAGVLGQYQNQQAIQNALKTTNAQSAALTPAAAPMANRSPGLWANQPVNTDAYQGGYI